MSIRLIQVSLQTKLELIALVRGATLPHKGIGAEGRMPRSGNEA